MAWVRFDNGLGGHRKALELSEELYLPALGLLVLAVCYCDQQRTDGYIPTKALPRVAFGDYASAAAELVRVGFFHEVEGGYQINDYLEWQMSAAQIEARSESQRQRALARWNPGGNASGIPGGNADKTRQDIQTDKTDEPREVSSIADLEAMQ